MQTLKPIQSFLARNSSAKDKPFALKYGLALTSVLYILIPIFYNSTILWSVSPFLMMIPSVIITSWVGGFLPGFWATIIGLLVGDFFFVHPLHTFIITNTDDWVRVILFGISGLCISILSQFFHNALADAKKEAKEAHYHELLLRESEERFRTIANHAPIMIWMTDKHGKIIFFNNQWLEFRGKQIEEEIGSLWREGIHPSDRKLFIKTYEKALQLQNSFTIECRIKRFDNLYRWISNSGVIRFDTKKNFLGFIGISEDITEHKETDLQKSTFLSVVSHELKTPIAIIRVIEQVLFDEYKKVIEKDTLLDLHSELERLTLLVDDLLDLSRIERGKLVIKKNKIDLSRVVAQVVKRMQIISRTHAIIWQKQHAFYVNADENRIKQVLINLIANAIKHSPNKSHVYISIEKKDRFITVAVKDEGIGISAKEQPYIFDMFYQVKDYFTKGFGLGLYIAKEIINQHNGTIWVKSKKGEGSTFYFTLPI